MVHAVVRTDKMQGTDNRAEVVSVRYQPGEAMTAIDNGNIVKAVELEAGSREIYKGVTPAQADVLADLVLVASVEVPYDERKKNLEDFENEAGKIARGYRFVQNGIFSVTKEALVGKAEPAVGDKVEVANGTKLSVVESEPTGTVAGKIIAIEKAGLRTYFVIEIA